MIRINKPAKIPKMLTDQGRGVEQARLDRAEFDTNPAGFLSGATKMSEKDNTIYRSRGVVTVLQKAQHNKCCYCERKRERSEIDVEHFRPKGAVKQARGLVELYPGYYWLAYSWDNLYLACKPCNTGCKGTLFPLADENRRSRWHEDANTVVNEEPLFIDPGFEDPSDHLRYNRDAPEAKTRKGTTTIRELGLASEKRPLLLEARLEKVRDLEYLCKVIEAAYYEPHVAELLELSEIAKQKLSAAVCPCAEFSMMAANFIEDYFQSAGILIDFPD